VFPTQDDCRDYTTSEIEPIFAATPVLSGLLSAADTDEVDRNTLLSRRFPGGSLKIVASRAPRNLRRHTARVLLIDEADGMETTSEGDPVTLATRRTLSFSNRKIVLGSTPRHEDTSIILRAYSESDQRVFEVPCFECGTFHELKWADIEWETDRPETASYRCPSCEALVPERDMKPAMIELGQWRATHPEVKNHAGFRLSALVSLLSNASWSRLAAEFLMAKSDPAELQVFTNTILAEGWSAPGTELDETSLAARAESLDPDHLPEEVLLITAGVDLQIDRVEISVVGWTKANEALVLEHGTLWGSPEVDASVWRELDEMLLMRIPHPFGFPMGISATIIDSGFATERCYEYCAPRLRRRIFAGKGVPGNRPPVAVSKSRIGGSERRIRLALCGVDNLKQQIFNRLEHGKSIRFSNKLTPEYFSQLASERRVVTMVRGQPKARFEKVARSARSESLDCLCYAIGARALIHGSMEALEQALRNRGTQPEVPVPEDKVPDPAWRQKARSWWAPREEVW